ncbi:MAG: IS630 family transposase, partial [Pseudomonadota bacterium]
TPTEVATAQRTTANTVHRWRNRFEAEDIDGLLERPRSGRPSVMDRETVDKVMFLTTKRIPEEATHWSIELMAQYAQVTPWQVRQIWKAADLRPHRLKTFKISTDPAFADKVVDIVGLYMNPPDNAVVLSVDEKTQIQALDRTQPGLPLNPSRIGSRTHDYKRNGTAALYAAFNTLTGKVIGKVTDKTNGKAFLSFLKLLNRRISAGKDLHIILDNLSAHKTPDVCEWLEAHPRIHLHFTPTSSSWLNAVEGWFAQLERRALYRGVFTSVPELKADLLRFIKVHNKNSAKPFKWTKPARNIIAAVGRAKDTLQN